MELDKLIEISIYISASSAIIPVISYLLHYKVRYPRYLHFIGLSVILSGLTDLIVRTLLILKKAAFISFIPFIHYAFFISHFCLLSLFYNELLFKKEKKRGPYLVAILFHGFCSITLLYFFSRGLFTYQGIIFSLGYFAFLLYSIYYLKIVLNVPEHERFHPSGVLWINAGILVYASVAIWAFILRDLAITGSISISVFYVVWSIHNTFNTIKNLLIAKGLYESGRSFKQTI